MADKPKFIGFNAPPDLASALADAATRQERSVSAEIRFALRKHLKKAPSHGKKLGALKVEQWSLLMDNLRGSLGRPDASTTVDVDLGMGEHVTFDSPKDSWFGNLVQAQVFRPIADSETILYVAEVAGRRPWCQPTPPGAIPVPIAQGRQRPLQPRPRAPRQLDRHHQRQHDDRRQRQALGAVHAQGHQRRRGDNARTSGSHRGQASTSSASRDGPGKSDPDDGGDDQHRIADCAGGLG